MPRALTFEDIDLLSTAARGDLSALPRPDAAVLDSVRAAIHKHVGSSGVLRQYINHLNSSARGLLPRNRFAWHAEGERLYAAAMLAAVGQPDGPTMAATDGSPMQAELGLGVAMLVLRAQTYLWSEEIEEIADATPLPPHVISRDVLPFPMMFWSREVAHVSPSGETNWLFIMHHAEGIRLVADLTRSPTDMTMAVGDIPYGAKFPDDFQGEVAPDAVGRILGRLAFLRSPYITAPEERLPRAWRREAKRRGVSAEIGDPLIRVVKLRREAQENVDRERRDRETTPTERRSHWWVSGHHRAQWYPSKAAHEVIWIAPYLKGNMKAPLSKKVYAVVR